MATQWGAELPYGAFRRVISGQKVSVLYTEERCLEKIKEIVSRCFGKRDGGYTETYGREAGIF
jgi:hypothetical protein